MRKLWGPGRHLDDYLADYNKDDKETEEVGGGHRALCAPETRTPLIIGSILMIFQQWSGFNAVVFYGGSIFKMAGIKEADQAQLYLKTTQVVFNFVSLNLMDRAGRRILMLAASGGMLFSLAVVGILFHLLSQGHFKEGWLMIVVLMG
uniref:Major facilitator superfamily (MFS) profile domain-containing protein n=1 Tax=Lotharella oceanica TaxID=641309 RepID=A0A7S2XID3_9EUKA|mmetsp:Transcript_9089/g.17715  ORF Transcript_9089/g.17715 Transcript_9089/m.17715 type:complete len:148 (+) Transcript_9089:391-834(+)